MRKLYSVVEFGSFGEIAVVIVLTYTLTMYNSSNLCDCEKTNFNIKSKSQKLIVSCFSFGSIEWMRNVPVCQRHVESNFTSGTNHFFFSLFIQDYFSKNVRTIQDLSTSVNRTLFPRAFNINDRK